MVDYIQGIVNGIFSGIGFFIVEIYLKPYMEQKRTLGFIKDKFIELKDLKNNNKNNVNSYLEKNYYNK